MALPLKRLRGIIGGPRIFCSESVRDGQATMVTIGDDLSGADFLGTRHRVDGGRMVDGDGKRQFRPGADLCRPPGGGEMKRDEYHPDTIELPYAASEAPCRSR
ncbi:hypothetical protein [Mycobacterium kansasii]|uniref:hypothetical protein n=1 Tax=Mycobacterium kansasii TaxID=1768 RepID=UPI0012EC65CA|nr:hypothetical protein [Mycobacterium kansasii]